VVRPFGRCVGWMRRRERCDGSHEINISGRCDRFRGSTGENDPTGLAVRRRRVDRIEQLEL
jgi:hypothetical protein